MSFKGALIDTGNVANLGIIKRNALLNSNEEVLEGIENIVTLSKDEKNGIKLEEIKFESSPTASLCIVSGQNHLQQFERNKLKLSVKVFMFPETFARDDEAYLKSITGESIEALCKLLNVTYIDNLILSIQTDESDRVLPNLKQAWAAYETITKENRKILSLGSSDLNADQLCELYNSTQIKPSSSQINLDSCCDIPADLSSFAKSNSIQLLTHNDPLADYLPLDRLKTMCESLQGSSELFRKAIPSSKIERKWVARYTLMLLGQGVLLSKGYLVSLQPL